ncbi:MAG: SDR family oxidoreductase [Gammaproteobacteria bacterium]|nr:SDR family oxidoreductase [Gammaproteobacteria bacterium]
MKTIKSILITGCSSGIGYCVATALKQRGYRVFATARATADVERLAAEGFEAYQLDLTDSDSINTAVDAILAVSDNRLDALFNNGAYGLPGAVEDLTREALRVQFETNVFGWIELTNRIIPVMRQQDDGRIIMNSSVLGFAAMAYRGAYNASKFAIEGFSDTLRIELKDTPIQVSLIEPGPISSQFRKNAKKAFDAFIDAENSLHKAQYLAMQDRLNKPGPAAPFTLPPEAVLKRVIDALESKQAKARYYVTLPTYLFGFLKRFLSSRVMDKILAKAGAEGKR